MTDNDGLVYLTEEYVEGLSDKVSVCHKRVDELLQEASDSETQLDHDIERMHEIDTRTNAMLHALQSGTFDESERQSELETLMREYDALTRLDDATLRYTEIIDELMFTIDVIIDIESELGCDAAVDPVTRERHTEEVRTYTEMKQKLEKRYVMLLR